MNSSSNAQRLQFGVTKQRKTFPLTKQIVTLYHWAVGISQSDNGVVQNFVFDYLSFISFQVRHKLFLASQIIFCYLRQN